MSYTWADWPEEVELPKLKRALERRYPGVNVSYCVRRRSGDDEGLSVEFRAQSADVLVAYGLARWNPRWPKGLLACGAPETVGLGAQQECGAYVYHHSYTCEYPLSRTSKFPPKYAVVEVECLMHRVRKSKRTPAKP